MPGHLVGDRAAVVPTHDAQAHVDTRGGARSGQYIAVVHEQDLRIQVDTRDPLAEATTHIPVRGGPAAVGTNAPVRMDTIRASGRTTAGAAATTMNDNGTNTDAQTMRAVRQHEFGAPEVRRDPHRRTRGGSQPHGLPAPRPRPLPEGPPDPGTGRLRSRRVGRSWHHHLPTGRRGLRHAAPPVRRRRARRAVADLAASGALRPGPERRLSAAGRGGCRVLCSPPAPARTSPSIRTPATLRSRASTLC